MRLATLVVLAATAAHATHDPFARGIDLVPVKPTAGARSGIALEGASLPDPKSWRFALMFDLNVGVLALKRGQEKLGDLMPFRGDLHLLGAWQIHRRVELAAHLPITFLQLPNFGLLEREGYTGERAPSPLGLGSVRLLPRFSILRTDQFPIGLVGIAEIRLPSPSAKELVGELGPVFAPRLAAEMPVGPLRVLATMGYRLRPYHAQYLNLFLGNEFVVGGGAIVGLPDLKQLTDVKLIGEMHLVTPTEAPFTFDKADSLKTPWELLVGARARVKGNWGVELTLGRGLGTTSGYGRETFRAMVGVRYDFEFQDRDGDGIPDHLDKCPDDPEDFDGFQDQDGCPEWDNDNDGVPDKEDGCPMDPGPKEYDGCPDRDGDQVPDNVDKCPDEAGVPEAEGCPVQPEVVLESDRLRVNGQILFETAEATIKPESFKMLDEVYKVLAENPEVGPVLIEGHTDNRGSREYNKGLSERRAKAVVDYLVKKGIAKKRLKWAGYGFDRPVADNSTPLGRAKNRRTEFKLVSEDSTEGKQEK